MLLFGEDLKKIVIKNNLAMIKQFVQNVNWGTLDYLLIDTPPGLFNLIAGTSDEHISIVEYLPKITGCILVTTPQAVT